MASPGDGRKRRSFIPAPKKAAGVSPTSSQAPCATELPQPEPKTSLLSSAGHSELNTSCTFVSSISPAANEKAGVSSQRSVHVDTAKIDELTFGVGLRVGAKVRIGGIKPGILRYLGTTHLAPGIFCGIELSDPDGNHDGEVNGHRYFVCAPNHGIFAPKEKVCLDSSSSLGRLASDTDVCYSSTESLNERTKKAFKSFEEGELEAIDCTKLSPILSPQEIKFTDNASHARHNRSLKLSDKSSLSTISGIESKSPSLESHELSDAACRKVQSGLPRVTKSSLITPPQSKLPTVIRAYKCSDGSILNQQSFSSHGGDIVPAPTIEAVSKIHNPANGLDRDQELDRSSPRHRTGSVKSVEDSEEDGFVRDTLSTVVKKQLRADSRQYLNFTFDEDELAQTVDLEGIESENNFQAQSAHGLNGPVSKPLNSDSTFTAHLSIGSRQQGCDGLASKASNNCFMNIETGTVLRADIPQVTPTPGGCDASCTIGSNSSTVWEGGVEQSLVMNVSCSETEDDGTGLSVTCSISDSDLPLDILPRVDKDAEGLQTRFVTFENKRLLEDGCTGRRSIDDRDGDTLNLTQTPDVHESGSYTISNDQNGSCLIQSQSYTICAGDPESKRDSSKRERESSVMASQSYIISKSDSAASSPCRKYRKISSSSANEGGDSSSSGTEPKTDSSGENKVDNLDDSSTGASPEVSQALEWDYGQEFDGKIPLSHQDNTMTTSTSTGTSESLSDVLRDMSEQSDGLFEADPPSSIMEDSDQFETPDNEFENIDSIEDFPIFGKDTVTAMTDSGISDKDFDFCPNKSSSSTVCGNSSDECSREDDASSHTTTRAISSDSSQETLAAEYVADTPGSIEDKDFLSDDMCTTIYTNDADDMSRRDSFGDGNSNSPASVVSLEDVNSIQERTLVCDDVVEDQDRNFSSQEDVSSHTDTSIFVKTVVKCDSSPGTSTQADHETNPFVSEGRMLNRRERPVSLLSTTSADTGYVPDSDSELGTLTTNSPNMDWMDRLGLTHPTSHAPSDKCLIDGLDGRDAGSEHNPQHSQPRTHSSSASLPLMPQSVMKTSDDDDYNSDLTTNTEDDRIEADQVYAHWTQEATQPMDVTVDVPIDVDIPGGDIGENDVNSSPSDQSQLKDSASFIVREESVDRKEGKDSNKEDTVKGRRSKTKKTITITKKRSENVDHKMPNTNVTSRLADYIKAPTILKPKDDKEMEPKKVNKNVKNTIQKRMSITEFSSSKLKLDTSRASSADRAINRRDGSADRLQADKLDKPKPVIKRTPPKSKWGNIMSQIEASKDTAKPKPKSEIKSSLAVYLSCPQSQLPPPDSDTNTLTVNMVKADPISNHPRKEVKSKLKQLPPPPPKIDFSKIKSKLNVPTAASAVKAAPKREHSPSSTKANNRSRALRVGQAETSIPMVNRDSKRMSDGSVVLIMQPLKGSMGSVRTSRTDISLCDSTESIQGSQTEEGVPSKRGSLDLSKRDGRRASTHSYKSEHFDKIRSRRDQVSRANNAYPNNSGAPYSPLKIPSRALEIKDGDGSTVLSRRSSPSPVIVKPIKPKPKSNSKTVLPSQRAWGLSKPVASPTTSPGKVRNSAGNQSSKPRANGAIKAITSNSRTTSASQAAQAEIIRLESLCEARTKELTHTKIHLKATSQAFDAMAVLVNYCCSDLNAFACPVVTRKLDTVQRQLSDCVSHIADLNVQKNALETNLTQVMQEKDEACKRAEDACSIIQKEREEHAKVTHEMDDTHNAALTTQRDELTSKHEESMKKFTQYYDRQIDMLRLTHERQVSDMKTESKLEMNDVKISHLEEIQELRNKHDSQMEELHKQHRNKLEDITHRFESIKLTLSEKVESLRGECDELARRARSSEDALQRDADAKVQIALAPYLSLPKEIESLKTVLEMRNEEIQKLRTKNMDFEKQLEEIPIGREKIISLQQKVENLEAIINIKTDHEKQLHEKCQILMRKYDRESRANKRLSMDYEQVVWRMSQSSEFGSSESLTRRHFSRSPPRSDDGSPDARHRDMSPNTGNNDVVMRVKKRSSHSLSEGDRKIRSRSATFVVEKTESSDSHSPSSSPQLKQKRWRKKSQTEQMATESQSSDRIRSSAETEVLTDVSKQQKLQSKMKNSDTLTDMNASQEMSSADMASSYARSLSGVSDSGMYDSMTKSDALDSSIVSTDSEWGTSVNLSMNCDSTLEDLESGPAAGEYNLLNNVTVIGNKETLSDVDNSFSTATYDLAFQNNCGSQNDEQNESYTYQLHVTLPEGSGVAEDNVFDEKVNLNSS